MAGPGEGRGGDGRGRDREQPVGPAGPDRGEAGLEGPGGHESRGVGQPGGLHVSYYIFLLRGEKNDLILVYWWQTSPQSVLFH